MVAALIVLTALWFKPAEQSQPAPGAMASTSNAPAHSARRPARVASTDLDPGLSSASASASASTNSTAQADDYPALSREEAEAALARCGTNAETLLAAAQVSSDRFFVRLAATNFPNDPAVQFAVASRKIFPEQQREWLERFKVSAPENALAGYLSAADYMVRGEKDQALQEFAEAVKRPHFEDYWRNSAQAAEELLLAAGKSPLEAKQVGMQGVLLPELAQFKQLSRDLVDAQKTYAAGGDQASADKLMAMNYKFAQTLSNGEGSGLLINQLVGYAMERNILNQLDPNTISPSLGVAPAQRLAELQSERAAIKELTAQLPEQIMNLGPDNPLMLSYFDRMKLFGEKAALKWLHDRRQNGN